MYRLLSLLVSTDRPLKARRMGINRVRFTGRLGGQALPHCRYRLIATRGDGRAPRVSSTVTAASWPRR